MSPASTGSTPSSFIRRDTSDRSRQAPTDTSHVPIHEWPEAMRPRERLPARGAQALSDDEILAILIGIGTRARSALVLANTALRTIGGLRALGQADATRLREAGLGAATAVRIAAACELGRRVVLAASEGERCDTPE